MHVNPLTGAHPLIFPLCIFFSASQMTQTTSSLTSDRGAMKFPFNVETLTLTLMCALYDSLPSPHRALQELNLGQRSAWSYSLGTCIFNFLTLTWSLMLHWLKELRGEKVRHKKQLILNTVVVCEK